MKLYEVLNENYVNKKIRFINAIDGILTIKRFNGRYHLINELGFFVERLERLVANEVELVFSKEEEFQEIADKDVIIQDKELKDVVLTVTSNYCDYESAKKQQDNIYIGIDSKIGNVSTSINFTEFKNIVKYVNDLRKSLDK